MNLMFFMNAFKQDVFVCVCVLPYHFSINSEPAMTYKIAMDCTGLLILSQFFSIEYISSLIFQNSDTLFLLEPHTPVSA